MAAAPSMPPPSSLRELMRSAVAPHKNWPRAYAARYQKSSQARSALTASPASCSASLITGTFLRTCKTKSTTTS